MNHDLWMTEARRLRERGEAFALVTVLKAVAPTSSKPGDKAAPAKADDKKAPAKKA